MVKANVLKREYPHRPIIGVGVVVLRGDDVLLIQRMKPPKQDEWSLPGGAQDVGETLKAAAKREVFEETGLSVDIQSLVDVIDFIDRSDDGRVRFHYSLIDFWAEAHTENTRAGDDAAAVKWIQLRDIDALDLWDETKRVIHLAAQLRNRAQNGR